MNPLPLPYRIPMQGTVLIEASAGTGKTHTLERLIARQILWHGHAIDAVLAVTFTNAAAADIRVRLRGFLTRCLQFDGLSADGDIALLYSGRPAEVSESQLRARLACALADFDRAAVYTIHGFCQRLLQDLALPMAQPIPAPALLEDESALRMQVCEEFWRRAARNPELADCLDAVFKSPRQMLVQLPDILSTAALKPDKPVLLRPEFAPAFAALNTAYLQAGDEALQILLVAHDDGTLNKRSHSPEAIENAFSALARYLGNGGQGPAPDTAKLSADSLKINKGKQLPPSSFLDALTTWNRFLDSMSLYQRDCRIFLYHALRDYARPRLAELKAQAGKIGFDDIINGVHDALQRDSDGKLAREIRQRYPVALVDEFQDTDERQWLIFERLYRGAAPASLILIGDPKQAIYGFRGGDIHTYLKVQSLADHRETLEYNFRSNQALLDGIASVFVGKHQQPFAEPGISFVKVKAGRAGATLAIDGESAPALAFFGPGCLGESTVTETRLACARQCADSIAGLLVLGRSGRAVVHSAETDARLGAGDIAVLVSKHNEAALIQNQLQQRGVAAVCVSRENLFETYEALDILQLLQVLEQPASTTARASADAGLLMRSAARPQDWPKMAQALAERGPLAAFGTLLDAARAVLLQRADGERRLANYLQVLELLQRRFQGLHGISHYLDWLARQISLQHGAYAEEAVRPNLQSSRPRVKIMTLHQSKGLEFGLVFMPFAAVRGTSNAKFARYFDGSQRCLHLDPGHADDGIKERIKQERASEQLRLLYVGMTRAKFGLRCGWGLVSGMAESALGHLLLANAPANAETCVDAIAGFDYQSGSTNTYLPAEPEPVALATPVPAFQNMPKAWQITSFSALHRTLESQWPGAEQTDSAGPDHNPFKGADFGNALHLVLEHTQAVAWLAGQASDSGLLLCRQALLSFGYAAALAKQGESILAELAGNTLTAMLPESVCLADLPAAEKRHELEFHLQLEDADSVRFLSLLQQYGYCLQRRHFGFKQTLYGLLTGKIDLLYRHDDRLYVLDYKSNLLPDYGPEALLQSIRQHEYDLQYLLYCVAVHRWLRVRRPDYRYHQHFGGVRYLYARGLDGARPGSGIYSDCPPEALISALDQCFRSGVADHG